MEGPTELSRTLDCACMAGGLTSSTGAAAMAMGDGETVYDRELAPLMADMTSFRSLADAAATLVAAGLKDAVGLGQTVSCHEAAYGRSCGGTLHRR